jgi:hypothetical protein
MWLIVQINNMGMDETIGDIPTRFLLVDKMPSSSLQLLCQAPNEEMKQNWVTQIRSLLDMQGDIVRGLLWIILFIVVCNTPCSSYY